VNADEINLQSFGFKPVAKSGLRPALSFADYLEADGVSNSLLTAARTPQHAVAYLAARENRTESEPQRFGRLSHTRILTPELCRTVEHPQTYATGKRTVEIINGNKQSIAEFKPWNWNATVCKTWRDIQRADGFEPISSKDEERLCRMSDALFSHKGAADLFSSLKSREITCFSKLQFDGRDVACKIRADFVPRAALADYKTCVDASPAAFQKSISEFGYHRQACFYRFVWNACNQAGATTRAQRAEFFFVAQEKTAPFAVAVFEMTNDAFDVAFEEIRQRMANVVVAIETPAAELTAAAYGAKPFKITLPEWHVNRVA
jgi:hypothetical protein